MASYPNKAMRYASLATQLMVMLLLAVWAGYKIDLYLNWKFPVFLILFPLLALVLSLIKLIVDLSKK